MITQSLLQGQRHQTDITRSAHQMRKTSQQLDAEAQDDIGQLFLISEKYQAAIHWFEQAAQKNNPDAMQWLGHCYINGKGVPQDENLGMMWTAKAAALGHVIARGQMKGLIGHALGSQFKNPNGV